MHPLEWGFASIYLMSTFWRSEVSVFVAASFLHHVDLSSTMDFKNLFHLLGYHLSHDPHWLVDSSVINLTIEKNTKPRSTRTLQLDKALFNRFTLHLQFSTFLLEVSNESFPSVRSITYSLVVRLTSCFSINMLLLGSKEVYKAQLLSQS